MTTYPSRRTKPRTVAGRALLAYTAGLPDTFQTPTWRVGIDAIEAEARNLGYADRLGEHISGLCGGSDTDWLGSEVVAAARLVVAEFRARPASLSAVHVRSLERLHDTLVALNDRATRRATRLDPDPLHPPEWDRPEDDDDDSGMVIVWVAVAVVATIAGVVGWWVILR